MSAVVHVVGAGLAGLSTAVRLAHGGIKVVLSEAAGQVGGRCRSYYDASLGCIIDNGNHLVLSGNRAVHTYLRLIGATGALTGPERAEYPFFNLKTGAGWTFRPNESAFPWWIFSPARRVPGTVARDYFRYAGLMKAGPFSRIGDLVPCEGVLWETLLRPVLLSALNTEPKDASAELAWTLLRKTVLRGGHSFRPRVARPTLAMAFLEPALAVLSAKGGEVRLNRRLKRLELGRGRVAALNFAGGREVLGIDDIVVLAMPPWVTAELLPDVAAPDDFRAIVNAHFRIRPPKKAPHILGVTGGLSEWIFAFADRISVTVSAAEAVVDAPRETLAGRIWAEVAHIFGLAPTLPPWQIVKEKRATFAATPEQVGKRPGTESISWSNLLLAGDWIDTGLPSTIESALTSGEMAAAAALSRIVG
jgi:hydroxysqualene dehydroxylase